VVAVSALLGGLHWIIGRRMRLAAEAAAVAPVMVAGDQAQSASPDAQADEHA
jgi:hypothetical protein